jgi:phospholipid-translocating ATPase
MSRTNAVVHSIDTGQANVTSKRTEQMLEKIATAKFISTIDLTKGYWQIPLDKQTISKSAFITPRGLFEFIVMPFGMKTAPATFQRMMRDNVLQV